MSNINFLLDLEIDEIGVTIDERCPNYTAGDENTSEDASTIYRPGVIRAMKGKYRTNQNNSFDNAVGKTKGNVKHILCKACGGINHCVTDPNTVCYNMAKFHMCHTFMSKEDNLSTVKANTYAYRKECKDRLHKKRMSTTMQSMIKKLGDDGTKNVEMQSLINLAQALDTDDDNSNGDDISVDSSNTE